MAARQFAVIVRLLAMASPPPPPAARRLIETAELYVCFDKAKLSPARGPDKPVGDANSVFTDPIVELVGGGDAIYSSGPFQPSAARSVVGLCVRRRRWLEELK
jgi:hypothetical protein